MINCVVSEYMKEKIYCLTLKIQTLIDFVKEKLQAHQHISQGSTELNVISHLLSCIQC